MILKLIISAIIIFMVGACVVLFVPISNETRNTFRKIKGDCMKPNGDGIDPTEG